MPGGHGAVPLKVTSLEAGSAMVDDRRDVPRYQLTLPILIGESTWGVTRNLSLDGVLFEAQQPFEAGQELDVTVYVTVGAASSVMRLQALGRVLRTDPLPDGRHAIAAHLENVRVLTDVSLEDYAASIP